MNVIVTNIDREYAQLRGDGITVDFHALNEYNVKFYLQLNGCVLNSNIEIMHEGDLSFSKAEEIIKSKIVGENHESIM